MSNSTKLQVVLSILISVICLGLGFAFPGSWGICLFFGIAWAARAWLVITCSRPPAVQKPRVHPPVKNPVSPAIVRVLQPELEKLGFTLAETEDYSMYASVCFVNGLTRFSLVAEVREQLVMLLLSRSDYQMYAPGSKIVGFESLVKLLPDIEPKEAKLLNRGVKAHKPEAVEFWLHERLPLILEILTLVDFETLLEIEADTSTA